MTMQTARCKEYMLSGAALKYRVRIKIQLCLNRFIFL